MRHLQLHSLSWLALALAGSVLGASQGLPPLAREALADVQGKEGVRAAAIASHVEALKATYGLSGSDQIQEVGRNTDPYGKTHVRFAQGYRGTRVWGSRLIGHMTSDGGFEKVQAKVFPGIDLQPADLLAADAVRARCLKRLGLQEEKTSPQVNLERIVFPTALQDGLKIKRNAKGELALDEAYSVATPRRSQPYVWAYHATVLQGRMGERGVTEMIVDATTGELLKKWDGRIYDAPATGNSEYNGTVSLNTNPFVWVNAWDSTWGPDLMPPSGTYNTLRDTTRTTAINPIWSVYDWMNVPGIATYWVDNYFSTSIPGGEIPYLVSGTEWGDGKPFAGFPAGDQSVTIATANLAVNGQTVAVDATHGVLKTWDFFRSVFGRNGMDDQGTPPAVFVHVNEGFYQTMTPMLNAYFVPYNQSMYFGDGDLRQGYGPFTSMDITAHEMSHGVVAGSGGLDNVGESGGLNEATADIFSAMTRFYSWGPNGGTGSVIPDTAPNAPTEDGVWTIGKQLTTSHQAIRSMYKPSQDGYSHDSWFDGIGLDDVHFTMGPGNRAFYFLAQGASSQPTAVSYSPCLPGGMTGLGNDTASRIWYRTLTTRLADPATDYAGFRTLMEETATELYGAGSNELAAVKNAFAAVNVGAPASGVEPVRVMLGRQVEGVVDETSGGYNWNSDLNRLIVIPVPGVPQTLPAPTITHATNTDYTWSLGGYSKAIAEQGGAIVGGKAFKAPYINHYLWTLKVSSNQDPSRYAATLAYACNMDTDTDTEFDALDLAAYAISWGRSQQYFPSSLVPLLDISNNSMTDDNDISLARLGFNSVFAH
ncbi:M4 family metallopeptidase [Mesoterricola silvestris]|uniref:Peptidase M4 n=1 Tax=Mesoterricola silvestris TaxID=2927979 RepID=A0AA48K7R8_9BACT|nr:M4 family metallopeptidase [Mesoterricola silvestris]BDU71436.1 peptidase M4 [Mesoterricola silvestris]